jgi:hypothetical protein
MFAVGLEGFDLRSEEKMFDIFMQYNVNENGKQISSFEIPLEPCKIEQWASIDI